MNQVLCRVTALTLLSIAPLAACRAKPVELAKPTSLPSRSGGAGRMDWWREATLSPPLETAVLAVKPWLPADAAKRIRYR